MTIDYNNKATMQNNETHEMELWITQSILNYSQDTEFHRGAHMHCIDSLVQSFFLPLKIPLYVMVSLVKH